MDVWKKLDGQKLSICVKYYLRFSSVNSGLILVISMNEFLIAQLVACWTLNAESRVQILPSVERVE